VLRRQRAGRRDGRLFTIVASAAGTVRPPREHEPSWCAGTGPAYCCEYVQCFIVVCMKTMIDLDDEALELAAKELGTTTKKDTVNAALEFVASRRRRIEQLLDDPYAFGVGQDITDPEIMRAARR
jgi:Arc/MetJ family transcription regulator